MRKTLSERSDNFLNKKIGEFNFVHLGWRGGVYREGN